MQNPEKEGDKGNIDAATVIAKAKLSKIFRRPECCELTRVLVAFLFCSESELGHLCVLLASFVVALGTFCN